MSIFNPYLCLVVIPSCLFVILLCLIIITIVLLCLYTHHVYRHGSNWKQWTLEGCCRPQEGVRDLPAQRGPYLVRALQRKLNLLLTLFWYPFFHMCLPALPASSLTSLCHLKYSVLFFKFALFSSSQLYPTFFEAGKDSMLYLASAHTSLRLDYSTTYSDVMEKTTLEALGWVLVFGGKLAPTHPQAAASLKPTIRCQLLLFCTETHIDCLLIYCDVTLHTLILFL